jgi:hypothetical protein
MKLRVGSAWGRRLEVRVSTAVCRPGNTLRYLASQCMRSNPQRRGGFRLAGARYPPLVHAPYQRTYPCTPCPWFLSPCRQVSVPAAQSPTPVPGRDSTRGCRDAVGLDHRCTAALLHSVPTSSLPHRRARRPHRDDGATVNIPAFT